MFDFCYLATYREKENPLVHLEFHLYPAYLLIVRFRVEVFILSLSSVNKEKRVPVTVNVG